LSPADKAAILKGFADELFAVTGDGFEVAEQVRAAGDLVIACWVQLA